MARNNLGAAPRYRCEYLCGMGHVVIDPNGALVQGSQTPFRVRAEQQRDALQLADDRTKKRGARACMCCGQEFESAGIHNRLCGYCRHKGDALGEDVRPSLPRGNGRRG